MAVKKSSKKGKGNFQAYKLEDRAGKNKLLKLQRHLKKFPGDAQAAEAVGAARQHKGRTAPKRTGARLNPYVGERDRIVLVEKEHDMFIVSRSLNLLSGRISAAGKRIQEGRAFSLAVRRQAAYDKAGKVFPKAKLTREERNLAKARAMGKAEAAGVSKAKQKKLANKAKGPVQKAKAKA
jgi:hypothetical protein